MLSLARSRGEAGFSVDGSRELIGRAQRLQSRGLVEMFVADAGDQRVRVTSAGWAQLLSMEPQTL